MRLGSGVWKERGVTYTGTIDVKCMRKISTGTVQCVYAQPGSKEENSCRRGKGE